MAQVPQFLAAGKLLKNKRIAITHPAAAQLLLRWDGFQ
jgi:hypothetical protein